MVPPMTAGKPPQRHKPRARRTRAGAELPMGTTDQSCRAGQRSGRANSRRGFDGHGRIIAHKTDRVIIFRFTRPSWLALCAIVAALGDLAVLPLHKKLGIREGSGRTQGYLRHGAMGWMNSGWGE